MGPCSKSPRQTEAPWERQHPLLNVLILKTIFSFVPTKHLIKFRLVCQTWECELPNLIKKRRDNPGVNWDRVQDKICCGVEVDIKNEIHPCFQSVGYYNVPFVFHDPYALKLHSYMVSSCLVKLYISAANTISLCETFKFISLFAFTVKTLKELSLSTPLKSIIRSYVRYQEPTFTENEQHNCMTNLIILNLEGTITYLAPRFCCQLITKSPKLEVLNIELPRHCRWFKVWYTCETVNFYIRLQQSVLPPSLKLMKIVESSAEYFGIYTLNVAPAFKEEVVKVLSRVEFSNIKVEIKWNPPRYS